MSLKIAGSVQSILQPLSIVARAIPSRPTIPILGCVKVIGKGDYAEFIGTDMQVTMCTKANNISAEGEGLIQSAKLLSLLKAIPIGAQYVDITADAISASIKCGGGKYKCAAGDPQDFPDIRNNLKVDEEGITTETKLLVNALRQVAHAVARQDVRYYLNGTFIDYREGVIDCVSSDGHRLARRIISVPSGTYLQQAFIIPSFTVEIATKVLISDATTIAAGRNSDNEISHIIFESEDTWIASKLIDGKYPDYKKVIPTEYTDEIKVNRQELIEVCRRCLIFLDQKMMGMDIKIDGNAIISCGSHADGTFAEEGVSVTRQGTQELNMFLNALYFLDGVSNFDSEYIAFNQQADTDKIVLTPCVDSTIPGDIELIIGMRR